MRGVGAVLLLAWSLLMPQFGEAAKVDLRGYGEVRASFEIDKHGEGIARFTCESETKAHILLSKLLADLFWDASDGYEEVSLNLRNEKIPVHYWHDYGFLIAGVKRKSVLVLGAWELSSLRRLVERHKSFLQDAQFEPRLHHPPALDYYDLRALKVFIHPMRSMEKLGLESHWKFAKRFGLSMSFIFNTIDQGYYEPAPGVVNWCSSDYEVRRAERESGMVRVVVGTHQAPLWFYNMFPEEMIQPDPHVLMGGWGNLGQCGAHYLSYGASDEAMSFALAHVARVIERYCKSKAVGAWAISAGAPGAEMGFHYLSGEFYDYSPAGQRGFREFLRKRKGFTLRQIGERWFGDPKHFKSWDEVRLPSTFEFFGEFGRDSFTLLRGWLRRPVGDEDIGEDEGWYRRAYREDGNWAKVDLAPSQEQLLFRKEPAWYRKWFDPSWWLRGKEGKKVYLVCNTYNMKPVDVWLNDHYLGKHKNKYGWEPGAFAIEVSKLLVSGANLLVLKVPEGRIYGPVFLTTSKPRVYPYLGKHANARYVDMREWQAYGLYRKHERVARVIATLDPDRPLMLSPGSSAEISDYVMELASRYRASCQFTGGGSWYHPWWVGLGYVNGVYGSSEEPATLSKTDAIPYDRELGWMLLTGESSHDFYWNIEHYMLLERNTGWFTKRRRLLQLFGKALMAKPKIALFRSARTMLLRPGGTARPWHWDIGRGELQSAHYSNVYVTEREIVNRAVWDYPVLFDCASEVIDERVLKALTDYVMNGGTFIALHNTGRHSPLVADAWVIRRLTGFRVVAERKSGRVHFVDDPPILKAFSGREFEGEGTALDWLGNENARGVSVGLKPEGKGAVALAYWDDGTVAIGYREIGKGRVIVLGSTFWRRGRDVAGVWKSQGEIERKFLEALFTDLGIERDANASSPLIWAKKFITKNGLQEWLLAFNNSEREVDGVTVSLRTQRRPRWVLDLINGKHAKFAWAEGWVHIGNLHFEPYETKAFAIRRTSLIGGLPFWWQEKVKYWRKPKVKGTLKLKRHRTDVIKLERWKLGTQNGWWKDVGLGLWWWFVPQLHGYRGIGLYQCRFTIPKNWQGRRITLGLYAFDTPIAYDKALIFLNGKEVTTYHARYWSQTYIYDITRWLREGENLLEVEVDGGEKFAGLAGALWIAPLQKFEHAIDLREWKNVRVARNKADAHNKQPLYKTKFTIAHQPQTITTRYLCCEVSIPPEWHGKSLFLRMEGEGQWLGSVMVNGRPINYNQSLHPYGAIAEVNLTPYAFAGGVNRIALFPMATIPHGPVGAPETRVTIESVLIGVCEGKGKLRMARPRPVMRGEVIPPPKTEVAQIRRMPARNVLLNGGFEDCVKVHTQWRNFWHKRGVKFVSQLVPRHWTFLWSSIYKDVTPHSSFALDDGVARTGKFSIRLTNGAPTDIAEVAYVAGGQLPTGEQWMPCKPNMRYRLRFWVKGEGISRAGGIIVWCNTAPKGAPNPWAAQRTHAFAFKELRGTFDWQRKWFDFCTNADDGLIRIVLQLRLCTGTVWIDDVELLEKEKVAITW